MDQSSCYGRDIPIRSQGQFEKGDLTTKIITSPFKIDQLEEFASSYDVGRVFRLFVNSLNGLDNASNAEGPIPETPPRFAEFREATNILSMMQDQNSVLMAKVSRTTIAPDSVPVEKITTEELIELKKAGFGVCKDDCDQFQLTKEKKVPVIKFSNDEDSLSLVTAFQSILGLDPFKFSYDVERVPAQFMNSPVGRNNNKLQIATRNIIQASNYLATGVQVPQQHIACGMVRVTRNPDGSLFDWNQVMGDLFCVHSCRRKPKNARVAVKYRGYWFYIANDDIASIETFHLFGIALANKVDWTSDASIKQPVLTLPVGR